jgi:SAM-dependent methyltransferase
VVNSPLMLDAERDYGDPTWWDRSYARSEGTTFDWLQTWESLRESLTQVIDREARILMLGCGNSLLSEQMYEAGFCSICNIDISPTVIGSMQERNSHRQMSWLVMDCTNLSFPPESFDVTLDKGTLDCFLCGQGGYTNAAAMTREAFRVLKPGGKHISISFGRPEIREMHFKARGLEWAVSNLALAKAALTAGRSAAGFHFLYVCAKPAARTVDRQRAFASAPSDPDVLD